MSFYKPEKYLDRSTLENALKAAQNDLQAILDESKGLADQNVKLQAARAEALSPSSIADAETLRATEAIAEALREGRKPDADALEAARMAAQAQIDAMPGQIQADAATVVIRENEARILEINKRELQGAQKALKVAEAHLAIAQVFVQRDRLVGALNVFVDEYVALKVVGGRANHLAGLAGLPPVASGEPVAETGFGDLINVEGVGPILNAGVIRAAIDAGLMHPSQGRYAVPRPVPFLPKNGSPDAK